MERRWLDWDTQSFFRITPATILSHAGRMQLHRAMMRGLEGPASPGRVKWGS